MFLSEFMLFLVWLSGVCPLQEAPRNTTNNKLFFICKKQFLIVCLSQLNMIEFLVPLSSALMHVNSSSKLLNS